MIGEVIAGYRIEAAIGAELHGHAYRARHPETNETVAIKIFAPEAAEIPGGLDSLFNELRASSLISQPGLVRIIDCDNPPGRAAYLIREDLKGESLRACLSRVGSFSRDLEAIRNIVMQTSQALSAAHGMALFHHCLSPETIFLTTALGQVPPFQIKLTEFGMGRFFQRQLNATLSGLQIPVAHLRYCSPEQCQGADSDQRADIYALGCILYEMLTGRRPFDEPNMAAMFLAHVTKRAPTLLRLAPGTPSELSDLVETMLEKDPAQRPFCMEEITAAINNILGVPQGGQDGAVDDRTTMFIDPAPPSPPLAGAVAQPRPASTPSPQTSSATTNLPPSPQPSSELPARFPLEASRSQGGGNQISKTPPPPTAAAPRIVGPGLPEVGGTQVLLAVRQEGPEGPGLATKRKKTSGRARTTPPKNDRFARGETADLEDAPAGVFNQRRNLIIIAFILVAGIALTGFWVMRPRSPRPPSTPKSTPIEQEASPPAKPQPTLKVQDLPPPVEEPQAEALPPQKSSAPDKPKVKRARPTRKKSVVRSGESDSSDPPSW